MIGAVVSRSRLDFDRTINDVNSVILSFFFLLFSDAQKEMPSTMDPSTSVSTGAAAAAAAAAAAPPPAPTIVELNVGGVFYTTTLATLTRDANSLLAHMFAAPDAAGDAAAGDAERRQRPRPTMVRDAKGNFPSSTSTCSQMFISCSMRFKVDMIGRFLVA